MGSFISTRAISSAVFKQAYVFAGVAQHYHTSQVIHMKDREKFEFASITF